MKEKIILKAIMIYTLLILVLAAPGEAAAEENLNDVLFMWDQQSPVVETGSYNKTNGLNVSAWSAVVMDATTGQVLYAKNEHVSRPIASTTKIMTALVAIECGRLKSEATVTPNAAGVEGSSIYLRAGEKLTLEELLYGALMHSGNDACVAIAEHVAGNEKMFINFMNYKAHRLGAKKTNFNNTNGLPDEKHFSSAYDLALITRHALENPVFSKIVSTKNHSIKGPQGNRILSNTNRMLWSYQGANGVKTGTTNAAGKCLVSSASRDGRRLIAVVLHSDDRWTESIRLLNYGFNNYENQLVTVKGATLTNIGVREGIKVKVPVMVSRDIIVTVPTNKKDHVEKIINLEKELMAPVRSGQIVGKIEVLVDGNKLGEADLLVQDEVPKLPYHRLLWQRLKE